MSDVDKFHDELIRSEERERCAQIAESHGLDPKLKGRKTYSRAALQAGAEIAKKIRGEQQ